MSSTHAACSMQHTHSLVACSPFQLTLPPLLPLSIQYRCVLWASAIMVTPDTGGTENFLPIGYSPMQGPITPAAATEVVIPPLGQYIREDGTPSFFSDVFEAWWWCLQTLTSEGYGVPWAPVSPTGKIIAIFAALFGTIILALPIAVVGVTFDDEWVKQAKINKFAVSRSPHYNAPTAPLPFAHTLSFPPSPHTGRVLRIRVQSDHTQRHTRRARPLQE